VSVTAAASKAPRGRTLRNPLPEGTLPVGVGLGVSGICLYGFLSIASRGLSKQDYAVFADFWPLLFVGGPGFFLPLEQEVGRALAARRANKQGCGPLVERAALAGITVAVLLIVAVLVVFPITGASGLFFNGNTLVLASLAAGLLVYFAEHLTRGTLSGNGRFNSYGLLMGSEGMYRIGGALILWAAHVQNPGYYAAVMVIGSVLAIATSLWGQHGLVDEGPHSTWTELSTALGFLLVTSVVTQGLINIGPLAVSALAHTPEEHAKAGIFLNGVIVARVPLFLFQAVQAALLPKLATYASTGRHGDLRRVLRRLLLLVGVIGVTATAGAFLVGPFVLDVMFGKSFELGHSDLGMLAGAASIFMVALVLTPALISLHGYWRALAGWLCAAVVFVLVTAAGSDLLGRVERGLVACAVAASAVLAALLLPLLQSPAAQSDVSTEEFIDSAIHVTGEP
jgi:O-antigen/teichoic acid export membrane protein